MYQLMIKRLFHPFPSCLTGTASRKKTAILPMLAVTILVGYSQLQAWLCDSGHRAGDVVFELHDQNTAGIKKIQKKLAQKLFTQCSVF